MNQSKQIQLLEQLLGLKADSSFFLDDEPTQSPVDDYLSQERFDREQTRILQKLPRIVAHSSELAIPNSFLQRTVSGLPLLLMRGDDDQLRIFLNVCRHRGTRLVNDETGCKRRFSCPYHAWTWNNRGEFVGAPHFDAGFPGLDRKDLGLKSLPCVERHGFIWVVPEDADLSLFLDEMDHDLSWVGTEQLTVHRSETQLRHCNWKMLPEGGLEAYHFRVAHRKTIAKLFNDNLSSYETFGAHIRSVLPRASMVELTAQDPATWNIREHTNVLYTLFPTNMLLVQMDHVVWIQVEPLTPELSEVRLTTLKPLESGEPEHYWDKNHALTVTTLNEDFDLAESIQTGLASGANRHLNFGRFEGALARFNDTVRSYIC
ncbi:MAG: aromatic ring-hydroxylating dioxygenase subunit alpha [Pseudomonadota bacterium]